MSYMARIGAPFAFAAFVIILSVYVLRVTPSDLTWLLFALTILSWCSFLVLGRAAAQVPHIGALTERTVIALLIAMLGTVACLIVWNTDAGRPLFDAVAASTMFRLSILGVLVVPAVWLGLWLTNNLGTGGRG